MKIVLCVLAMLASSYYTQVISKPIKVTGKFTREEILDSMVCLGKSAFGRSLKMKQVKKRVNDVIDKGIKDDEKHIEYFMSNGEKVKFVFWRDSNKAYGDIMKKGGDGAWQTAKRVFRDLKQDNSCFKLIPKGCKYHGTAKTFVEKICRGYDKMPQKIGKGLIKLSVNKAINNPEIVSDDIAECLTKHMNKFSVQLECAVPGIPMDHEWALNKLQEMAKEFRAQGKTNVKVDTDNLKITYDQEGKTTKKQVKVNEADFKLKKK